MVFIFDMKVAYSVNLRLEANKIVSVFQHVKTIYCLLAIYYTSLNQQRGIQRQRYDFYYIPVSRCRLHTE